MGVTPLLRRRLLRFTLVRFFHSYAFRLSLWPLLALAGWFHSALPRYASSFALLTPLSLSGNLRLSLTSSLLSPLQRSLLSCFSLLRRVASPLPFELDLRSGLPLRWI